MTDSAIPYMDTLIEESARRPVAPKGPSVALAKARPPGRHSRWIVAAAIGLGLTATAVYLPQAYFQATDDAYVQADTIPIAPKVAGYVTALHVTDNSLFHAGELLLEIDPRDFQAALAGAQGNLEIARATKANVEQQLQQQAKLIDGAQATIANDRATLQFAQQQLARYAKLAHDGAGTVQSWQQYQSDVGAHTAALDHDLAALAATQGMVGVLQTQAQEADGTIARAVAALDQARLNLSYTKIYAQTDGSVANRTVQVGSFVQPGQLLFSAVPTQSYFIANFKETQLVHMRVGQPVAIHVDALGGERIEGHIDSFQRGTGSNFALLPPENATGNFVKVVQRVPVKIVLDGPSGALNRMAPGMSVEATVSIRPAPKWLAWLL
jgi:membrane fusion protein, multidrug efflux system